MKKVIVLLTTIVALLFIAACGTESTPVSDTSNETSPTPTPQASAPESPPADEPPALETSPGTVISAFFGYLAGGNPQAADAIFIYSNGDFADVAEEMYEMLGAFIFQNIAYSNLSYTINGNNATATFSIENVDFFQASYDAGFQIGSAGLVDIDDPDFEAQIEALIMPLIGEMINEGTAPMLETDVTINLRLINDQWRIADDNMDFAMALLGMV